MHLMDKPVDIAAEATFHSWGRYPVVSHLGCYLPSDAAEIESSFKAAKASLLPRGMGRSYGDSCLNESGYLLSTKRLNRIHAIDAEHGTICCGSGVTIEQILRTVVPIGWFLPVVPGTKFVTVGGAIANDIHGKNHHLAGSFGNHVQSFELLRSDGTRIHCASNENRPWFSATVGGLGLTGVITQAELQLKRLESVYIDVEEVKFFGFDEFEDISRESSAGYEYVVSWIDCLASGDRMGRGILMRGRHSASNSENGDRALHKVSKWQKIPFSAPGFIVSRIPMTIFNSAFFNMRFGAQRSLRAHYDVFFFPLDRILEWNRLYGRKGFLQWQCVIPKQCSNGTIKEILERIARSKLGAFLAVLKEFGDIPSEGLLSFPMPGTTLAVDFRNTGEPLFRLLDELDDLVVQHGGRIYPAKDARMKPATFRAGFAEIDAFERYIDPKFSSSFYRRMTKRIETEGRKINFGGAEMPDKPNLLSVEDVKALQVKNVEEIYKDHMNPGQIRFLRLLGFDRIKVEAAEGMYYTDQKGEKILDFFGGFGSLGFGHNHPRILEVRRQFQEERRHEIAIAFMSQYAAGLCRNLTLISPGDLNFAFLCCSGSEAVEAALKLAEKAQGPERSRIAYATQSFHGKTRGALSVTDSEFYQSTFALLDNRVRVLFGDIASLEETLAKDRSIGIVILESIQGGAGVVLPPDGYLKNVRAVCDRHNVLYVADEVQCGMGRTGRFFAFEHEDVVPDIVTLAKSLGGGKVAMGAFIARSSVYMKAYGSPKTALIHGPATFGAMGEACCTAIEALNVLYDEKLMENAEEQGNYLLARLDEIRRKCPTMIKEIRGRGLMVGIEFADISNSLPFGIRHVVSKLDDKLKGSLCGFVGSLLLAEHNILIAFTEYNRNVIRLEPPLIVAKEHIDHFIGCLDNLLSRGVTKIVMDYAKNFLKGS